MQLTDVGLISHLVAALGFLALAVIVLRRRELGAISPWLAGVALLTALWAANFVLAARYGGLYATLISPAETLRSAGWIALLVGLLQGSWRLDERHRSAFVVATMIGFVVALQLVLDLLAGFGTGAASRLFDQPLVAQLFVVTRLIVAISGLVLVHNLYVNAAPASRAGARFVCIGLAGLFGYDLNLYTLQFSLGELSPDLYNIRGAVDAMVVPLLLLGAHRSWTARVNVSRQVVFHTLSFSIIGGYLIVMSIAAYGLRLVGGDWGRLLQITFLFATAILGAIVIFSPRFRALLRVQISKHFFAYRYDYRQEWLRFIATVSGTGKVAGPLVERVIEGVCTVIESPGGALYAAVEDNGLEVAGQWNWREFAGTAIPADSDFARFLANRQRIVDFDELRAGAGDYDGLVVPDWAAAPRVWLAVPLVHLDKLAGCLILERTLAPRTLNWEDYDLLRTLGRQAASYIAEATTQAALDEAAKFDEFNRRFAFIMHDIKNVVSQLSLVARNAERHADNPAFRADMAVTLQSSVAKMHDLLARLAPRDGGRAPEHWSAVDVGALLADVVAVKRRAHPPLTLVAETAPLSVGGDPGRLEQLFVHLIQNAIDASDADGAVRVTARRADGHLVIEIADDGVGMSPAFVRGELFKPFHSTKPGGFGIGAYEAREIARALGGRLDVVSREGEGTLFTIVLPALAAAPLRATA